MQIDKIKAIHSDDMEKYLESLGVLEDIKAGKIVCSICSKQITIDNITCIYPEDKQIKFCCNKSGCYESLIRKRAK